jgi:hypothetical protein
MFKTGDKVEFECSSQDFYNNQPRWKDNTDLGGSGVWAIGEVVDVDENKIVVSYQIEGYIGTGQCIWPNRSHPDYHPTQWCFEGYLRPIAVEKLKCECGSDRVYGPSNLAHDYWCPKSRR